MRRPGSDPASSLARVEVSKGYSSGRSNAGPFVILILVPHPSNPIAH